MTHDELASLLAEHLRGNPDRMVWENTNTGMAGTVRPDVFAMFKSYTRPRPMTYEVKVNRSDLDRDLREGKWQAYLDFSAGVVFCFPKGLATRDEIPRPAGVMVYDAGTGRFRTIRAATLGMAVPDFVFMQKLLIDGVNRVLPQLQEFNAQRWLRNQAEKGELSERVAKALSDINWAESVLDQISRRQLQVEEQIREAWEKHERALEAVRLDTVMGTMLERIARIFDVDLTQYHPSQWEERVGRAITRADPKILRSTVRHDLRGIHSELGRLSRSIERRLDQIDKEEEQRCG